VHTTFLGGGFGRKFELDAIMQAVFAAKAVGRPVKVIWSREEDMRHDFYRPAAMCRLEGGIDAAGGLSALSCKIVCPSIFARVNPARIKDGIDPTSVEGIAKMPYRVGARRVDYLMQDTGVPVGFWRSVGSSQNAFFLECFVDELAAAAGKDPLAFRRQLLAEEPRFRGVLNAAAALAGWDKPLPGGRHRGLALHECFGSIVAEVVEISLLEGRRLRVHKVACVVDCGRAVNPANIRAQMESGIVYGLTAALFGEITIANGGAVQGNFDTYDMLKLSHMPAIEVGILETGDKLGGIGEPGTPPIAPAVVNAIAAATGRRIRSLPLSKHGIVPA
jgi:isoquinoline 1-oxidoreductase beta subunit